MALHTLDTYMAPAIIIFFGYCIGFGIVVISTPFSGLQALVSSYRFKLGIVIPMWFFIFIFLYMFDSSTLAHFFGFLGITLR